MDAWTDSEALAAEAVDTSGNAMANQEKYAESLAGTLQSISTEANTFWLNFLNSDFFKDFLKEFRDFLKNLNSFAEEFGNGTTLGLAAGGALIGKQFFGAFAGGFAEALKNNGGVITKSIIGGFSSLASTIAMNAPFLAVAAGAGIATAAISKHSESVKQAKNDAIEQAEAIDATKASLESYAEEIESLKETISNSSSSVEEVRSARERLYDIQNKLVETYGEEAKQLDLVNGRYEKQKALLDGISDEKAKKWLNEEHEVSFGKNKYNSDYFKDALNYLLSDRGDSTFTTGHFDENGIYHRPQEVVSAGWIQNGDLTEKLNSIVADINGISMTFSDSMASVVGTGDIEDINKGLHQFLNELNTLIITNDYGKEGDADLMQVYNAVSDFVKKQDTDIAEQREFAIAGLKSLVASFDGTKTYENLIKAEEDYNKAVDNGVKEEIDAAQATYKAALAAWNALLNKIVTDSGGKYGVNNGTFDLLYDQSALTPAEAKQRLKGSLSRYTAEGWDRHSAGSEIGRGLNEIKELSPFIRGADFENENFTFASETAQKAWEKILSLGKEYGLTQKDVVKILKDEGYLLDNIEKKQDAVTKKSSKSEMIDAISDLSDGFSALDQVYADVKDGDTFDFSKLNTKKFEGAFDGLEKEYTDFIETVSASPNDIEKCQSAFNDLAEAYIKHSGVLDKITPENAQLLDDYMKLYGVTLTYSDGVSVATANANALSAQEEILAQENINVGDAATWMDEATAASAGALIAEGNYADSTRYALYNLCLQQITFNNSGLDVSGKIQALAQLEGQAYATAGAIAAATSLSGAEAAWSEMDRVTQESYGSKEGYLNAYYNAHSDLFQHNLKKQYKTDIDTTYTGGPKSSGAGGSGGSGGDSNKGESASYDLAEIAVENMERNRDRMKRIADDEARTYTERFKAFKDENDKLRQEALANLKKYADEYNKITNGNLDYNKRPYLYDPETGEYNTTLDQDIHIGEGESSFTIKIATILEDGTKLTPEQVDNYIKTLDPTSAESLLASDTKNLIIQYAQGDFVEGMWDTLNQQLDAVKQEALEAYRAYEALKNNTDTVIEYDEALIDIYKQNVEAKKKIKDDAAQKIGELFGDDSARILDLLENGAMLPDDVELKFEAGEITKEQKEAIDKFLDAIKEVYAAEDKLADGEKQLHDDRMEYYEKELELLDNILALQQAQGELYEAELELKEASGQLITAGDYQVLIDNAEEVKKIYEQQIGVLQQQAGEMEPLSAEWYGVQAEIMNARTELVELTKQQVEWNEQIRKIPINLMSQYLSRLRAIRDLVEGYQTIETAFGRYPDTDSYQELFGIGQRDIDRMYEQANEYQELLKSYEWGSEKYDETAEAIESIQSEINSVIESMIEWNKEILNLPLQKFQDLTNQMNLIVTSINEIEGEYDQVINAVTTAISKQTEEIEKQQEAFDDGIDEQIKALQEQLDLLQKTNDEREHQNALEQAQFDLDKANHQKTIAIIRDGELVYEADQEAIRKAQEELEQAEYEMQVFRLEQQIEALEKEKEKQDELYADEIENLGKISEKWSEITDNIKYARDALKADEYLGDNWLDMVLGRNGLNDNAIYEEFKKNYENYDKSLLSYEEAVASNERIATLMEQYINEFMKGNITLEEAQAGVIAIVNNVKDGLNVEETLGQYQNLFQNIFNTSNNSLGTILAAMQESARSELNSYLGTAVKDENGIYTSGWFDLANQNNILLDNYTQSWHELKDTVEKLLEQLEKDYQEALERSKALKSVGRYLMDSNEDNGRDHGDYADRYISAGVGGEWYDTGTSGNSYSSYADAWDDFVDSVSFYHTGVNEGLVNASGDEKLKAFKDLTLKPLARGEVPAILKQGELVLTEGQQGMLLRNASKLMQTPATLAQQGINVNLTMSNLTFHEINNGQDFANYITTNLSSAISQGLARR